MTHLRLMLLHVALAASCLLAQQDRVRERIDSHRTVKLNGSVRLEAQQRFDQGRVDPARRLTGMTLMLKSSLRQQADLEKLLDDLQNPASPRYHDWLTPQQFADRFAVSPADLAGITAWLDEQGLSVDYVADSRNWVLFSGSAAQVEKAFSTELRHYFVDGEKHFANRTAPFIPAALEPVVQTLWGLDDFKLKSQLRRGREVNFTPGYTAGDGSHYLLPGDLSIIYNTKGLLDQKITGAGQKVVIVGQAKVDLTDIQYYRTILSKLPINDPQLILVKGSAVPGTEDLDEADLDLEVAGGLAPDATVLYVYSTNVMTSVQYAVDQNLAPIISMSYGGCEAKMTGGTVANANAFRSIAQQAVALGITWVASTGDQGAGGCDYGAKIAISGPGVQIPSTIPEVTAIGGTEFVEGTSTAYWNSQTPTSALSYIPEMVWNDTAASGSLSSGVGGVSIFYPKPAWQTGPGVPADNARDVPDISFSAASYHDPYLINTGGKNILIGGTSASTPAFAGMLVLLNQYLVQTGAIAKPGLGNINPNLYSLWNNTTGIFHDCTLGDNIVPCKAGTPGCVNGTFGFKAGPGYDLGTGIGSLDLTRLAQNWTSKPLTATTTTVSASPASLAITDSTVVTATVKAASGATSPSGAVTFAAGANNLGSANMTGTGGTATATLTVSGHQLATGANTIKAAYSGAAAFSGSNATTTVTVTVPTTASAVVPSVTPNPAYQQAPDAAGNRWFVTAKLTEVAGVATTLTSFSVAGKDLSTSIPTLFGSSNISARGTLSATVGINATTVPSTVAVTFGGKDAGGAAWTQQINVQLYGPQLSASLSLSSAPATEVLNARGEPNCSGGGIYQELNLQELNGKGVTLTKFLAAGYDLTPNTSTWFGSWRIAPLGTLQARLCWPVTAADLPATYDYEIDGVDDQGNAVKTTLSVPFQLPAQNPGALSASKTDFPTGLNPGQSTTASFAVTVPAGQQWAVAKFPSNQTTGWLLVSPQSGTGPGTVNLTISSTGMALGAYRATLVLQSVNTVPQFENITVSLLVGSASPTTITGVAQGASFQQKYAPGMVLSVFGTALSNSNTALFASSVPLPMSIGGVSATVNGIPAPLYYTSPLQLNIQVPYETGSGYALLAVNNNGQVAAQYFLVGDAAPGIFVGANNALVPIATAKRGDVLTLFMTGEGDVNPPIATGASPTADTPLSKLPSPRLKPFTLTVAGQTVTPLFVGIPYGLVGETQINFPVPANAPLGSQNVIVTVGTQSSVAAKINITQ